MDIVYIQSYPGVWVKSVLSFIYQCPNPDTGLADLCEECDLALDVPSDVSWWITNHDFQMQLLIGCQQSCQPIRSHIRKSRLVNRDFILG